MVSVTHQHKVRDGPAFLIARKLIEALAAFFCCLDMAYLTNKHAFGVHH